VHSRFIASNMITEIRISAELSTAYHGAYFRLEAGFRDHVPVVGLLGST
jgi:hypothetical protein